MRALSITQPGLLERIEKPDPIIKPGEVLLRIGRAGICGTDIHAFRGQQPYFTFPRIPGHELAATIADPGTSGLTKGDWVTVIPYRHCGQCIACRNNRTNCCSAMRVYGVHIDGGMAEFLSVPKELLFAAPGLSPKALAVLEPLAIGTHAVRRTNLAEGETVVVVGLGPIGIGVAAAALQQGARVIAAEKSTERRKWVSHHMTDITLVPEDQTDLMSAIRELTGGDFASAVFEATGNLDALEETLSLLSHGGTIVLVGLQSQSFRFLHPDFHKREATLMSSRNATSVDFNTAAQLITECHFPVDAYVGAEIPFSQMPETMPEICGPGSPSHVIKNHVLIH